MTAAPASVQPITVEQLRGIVEGLGKYKVPPDDALAVLAAVLTGWQSCNDAVKWDYRVVEHGRARIENLPPGLRLTFDADARAIGHPRPRRGNRGQTRIREKGWHDLAPDVAARFREMMTKANPGQGFGDRGGPVAHFVAAVIPLVFADQMPDANTIGQFLARHRREQETRARR